MWPNRRGRQPRPVRRSGLAGRRHSGLQRAGARSTAPLACARCRQDSWKWLRIAVDDRWSGRPVSALNASKANAVGGRGGGGTGCGSPNARRASRRSRNTHPNRSPGANNRANGCAGSTRESCTTSTLPRPLVANAGSRGYSTRPGTGRTTTCAAAGNRRRPAAVSVVVIARRHRPPRLWRRR